MRSLITGSSGFIGSRLCDLLEIEGHEIIKISRKIGQDSTNNLICDLEQDTLEDKLMTGVNNVFHLAGYAHDLSNPEEARDRYYNLNVRATKNLATQAAENGVEKFIFISSVKAELVNLNDNQKNKNLGIYGATKREAELELVKLSSKTNMKIHIVRPSLVYGSGVKGNLLNMRNAIERGWFPPLPNIKNTKSLIHVDDLVRAILLVFERGIDREIYNVTDGQIYTSTEIYETLCRIVKKKPPSLRLPFFFIKIMTFLPRGIGRRVKKLLDSEEYSSSKIESLGYDAKLRLENFNETLF